MPCDCETEPLFAGCKLRAILSLQELPAVPGECPASSSKPVTVDRPLSHFEFLLPLLPLHFSLTLCLPLSALRVHVLLSGQSDYPRTISLHELELISNLSSAKSPLPRNANKSTGPGGYIMDIFWGPLLYKPQRSIFLSK